MTLEELTAREEIKEAKARYCRFIDTKDWAGMEDLFTEDMVLDVEDVGEIKYGREAALGLIKWSVTDAKTAHQVHTVEIRLTGPDSADAVWAMQDRVIWAPGKSPIAPAQAITGWGQYHERYVKLDGAWRIASLKLTRFMVETE
jgi:hypothetical protein